jgi:hypothetical protein
MTTLKEHQAAMVNLLASGSGIPASASRLAHALHDVLALITTQPVAAVAHTERRSDATTPGLNDKLLALDVAAVRPVHMENTTRQLKGRVEVLVQERDIARSDLQLSLAEIRCLKNPEQAACRKEDTQVCEHDWVYMAGLYMGLDHPANVKPYDYCTKCGVKQ